MNFKWAYNLRTRISRVFKAQNVRKKNKTFDLLDCSHTFLNKWIACQLYGDMILENYGSIWFGKHCIPIASFNILDEKQMRNCFSWIILRPLYSSENISRKDKANHHLYLLQKIRAHYFIRLNEEGHNKDIHR